MRTALSIIFSLLVVVGQTMPASSAAIAVKRCCGCDCTEKNCCYREASPKTPSAPMAAPVRQVSSEQLQTLIREAVATVTAPDLAVWLPISNFSFSFGSTALPLYYRNCSLLI